MAARSSRALPLMAGRSVRPPRCAPQQPGAPAGDGAAPARRASSTGSAKRPRLVEPADGPPSAHAAVRGLFVTGTDTGVGKSVVAAAICAALAARGERVAAFKPVVTGLDEPPEAGWPRRPRAAGRRRRRRPDAGEVTPLHVPGPGLAPLRGGARGTSRSIPPASRRRRARPPSGADAWSARESAACSCRSPSSYSVRDLAVELGAAGGGGGAHRARHDQPLAAHRRGGSVGGAPRGGRRDVAVARARRADPGIEPRRPSSASQACGSAAFRQTTPAELAAAGAALPLDDWF